jgi:hypothetical protein
MARKKIWMLCTKDKYNLPLAIYETAREMSNAVGVSTGTLYSYINKVKVNGWKYPKYVNVEIDDEEDDA